MLMTATRDIEAQKQRYASELAAHTRNQWDMARQALESQKSQPKETRQQSAAPPIIARGANNARGSQGQHLSA